MHEIGRNSKWDMAKSRRMEGLENMVYKDLDQRTRQRGD